MELDLWNTLTELEVTPLPSEPSPREGTPPAHPRPKGDGKPMAELARSSTDQLAAEALQQVVAQGSPTLPDWLAEQRRAMSIDPAMYAGVERITTHTITWAWRVDASLVRLGATGLPEDRCVPVTGTAEVLDALMDFLGTSPDIGEPQDSDHVCLHIAWAADGAAGLWLYGFGRTGVFASA